MSTRPNDHRIHAAISGMSSVAFYKAATGALLGIVAWAAIRIVNQVDAAATQQAADMQRLMPVIQQVAAVGKQVDTLQGQVDRNQSSLFDLKGAVSELKGFVAGMDGGNNQKKQ